MKFALKRFLAANKGANVDPVVYEVDDQGDPAVAGPIAPKVPTTSATVAIAEMIFFMYCLSCSCVPGQGDGKGNGKGRFRTRRK